MQFTNHLFYFNDRKRSQNTLLYWPINLDQAQRIISEINTEFYSLYQTDLPLNTWQVILNYLFKAIDFTEVLPATKIKIQHDIQTNPKLASLPFVIEYAAGYTDPKTAPIITAIVNTNKIPHHINGKQLILTNDQIQWLKNYFLGKIKLKIVKISPNQNSQAPSTKKNAS